MYIRYYQKPKVVLEKQVSFDDSTWVVMNLVLKCGIKQGFNMYWMFNITDADCKVGFVGKT